MSDTGELLSRNVEKSYRRGIELALSAVATKWLTVGGNATLSQNHILDYVDYIDEGPQFGLLVRLDPIAWSPYMTHQAIAQLIVDEVQDALDANYRNFKPCIEEA